MSATAAWSTKATPLAGVAEAVVFTLGVFCIVHAAITLALGGAAWNLPAYACLLLTALLAVVRLMRRRTAHALRWDAIGGSFRIADVPGGLVLTRVWYGAGWVTLGLRPAEAPGRMLHLVIWKSTIPAPLWNELVLRTQAHPLREASHQNKENP